MTFTELFKQQLNNPKCSLFSGMFMGMYFTAKGMFMGMYFTAKLLFYMVITSLSIALALSYFLIKAIDKLAFEPFIVWIKSKLKLLCKKKNLIKRKLRIKMKEMTQG